MKGRAGADSLFGILGPLAQRYNVIVPSGWERKKMKESVKVSTLRRMVGRITEEAQDGLRNAMEVRRELECIILTSSRCCVCAAHMY